MYNSIVDAIVLTGQDSISFVNSLYRPSSEEVEHARRILNEIDQNVKIEQVQRGFKADILDLDLSFLEDMYLSIESTYIMNQANENKYNSSIQSYGYIISECMEAKEMTEKFQNDFSYLYMAA